jgi:hypothetical protein
MNTYRIEHRDDEGTTILGRTDAPAAGQAELSARAMQLIADGARGELVLVDEATGEEVARRSLQPDPGMDQNHLSSVPTA